jgi:hypothetical protein
MLGRYTPAALECAGMTRMHATRTAASVLDVEHLAMALLMMSPTLFDWLSTEDVEKVRRAIDPRAAPHDACGIAMSGGAGAGAMPPQPSQALKRVVDRSEEDAGRLHHQRIAPEHLLASLLGEADAPAVVALAGLGVTRQRVLDDMVAQRVTVRGVAPPTREALKQRVIEWIDRLPDDALDPVEMMVDGAERHQLGNSARHPDLPEPEPGRPLSEEPPWTFRMPPAFAAFKQNRAVSTRSSSSTEGDAHVFTTRRSVHGHEITTTERFQVNEDGRTISYSQEVRGPGHTSERQIAFAVVPGIPGGPGPV